MTNKERFLNYDDMVEDYYFFWELLYDSFPYMNLCERKGADLQYIEMENKEKLHKIKTREDYFRFFKNIIEEISGGNRIGHLGVIGGKTQYESYLELYDSLSQINPRYEPYSQVLNDDKVKEFNSFKLDDLDIEGEEKDIVQLETKIIEEDKIAYIRIDTFLNSFVDRDREKLYDFYDKVQDYPNIIFDITRNTGGSSQYWNKNIVSPNIEDNIDMKYYFLYMKSIHTRMYWDRNDDEKEMIYGETIDMPDLPNTNKEDLSLMDSYQKVRWTIEPEFDYPKLNGKIWILSSERNYSASEQFLSFAKDKGFATIVGNTGGGDGIGTDPILMKLPYSGLVLRYSMHYGLNPDGSSNQEFGTKPDYFNRDGMDALNTCLSIIREEE